MKRFLLISFLIFTWSAFASGELLYQKDFTILCTEPLDWTVLSGDWHCVSTEGLYDNKSKGTIIGTPFAGCDVCTVWNVFFFFDPGRHLSLLAWYQDEDNFVELTANPKYNGTMKWTLTQFVNGAVGAKESGETIWFKEDWSATTAVDFDGNTFTVIIGDSPPALFQMEKAPGSTPFGKVGYRHKSGNANFASLAVYSGPFCWPVNSCP